MYCVVEKTLSDCATGETVYDRKYGSGSGQSGHFFKPVPAKYWPDFFSNISND